MDGNAVTVYFESIQNIEAEGGFDRDGLLRLQVSDGKGITGSVIDLDD
jgi:hypothetical protein